MPTQREKSRAITDAGGDYICALKGNPKTLYGDMKLYLEDSDQAASLKVSVSDVNKGHGPIEAHTATVCHAIDGLCDHDRPSLVATGPVTAAQICVATY